MGQDTPSWARVISFALRLGLVQQTTAERASAELKAAGDDALTPATIGGWLGLPEDTIRHLHDLARTLPPDAADAEAAETLRLRKGSPASPGSTEVAALADALLSPTVAGEGASTAPAAPEGPPSPDAPTVRLGVGAGAVPPGRPLPPDAPRRLGPYVLLSELGRGGMGAVYLAQEQTLARQVALKVMLPRFAEEPGALERFYREARACAGLNHPHVVSVLGFGEAEGTHYYAMEYVEGRSAAEVIRREPLSQERAAYLVLQAARGLAHAHEKGVVHRDVKPQNLMVAWRRVERLGDRPPRERTAVAQATASYGEQTSRHPDAVENAHPTVARSYEDFVKVADFGLARVAGAQTLTQTGAGMGTPLYMSPEQFLSAKDVGPPSDVYSLGVTLYEMLTGRPPFWGEDAYAIQRRVEKEDPVPPRRLVPTLDRDLESVTLKCLEREPGRRYASAAALADDLGRWVRGEPVQARPVSWASQLWRRAVRRRRVVLPMAAALALAVGLGSWMGVDALNRARKVNEWLAAARHAEADGDRTGSKKDFERARDLVSQVLGLARDNGEALGAQVRIARRLAAITESERVEVVEAKEALAKSRPVSDVLTRFRDLAEAVERMETVFFDDRLSLADKQRLNAERWGEVARWMAATPKDNASQATMLAFAGWARRLAGYEEGLGWMRHGKDLDPDIPYGAFLLALVPFSRYVEMQELPSFRIRGAGVEFDSTPSETAAMVTLRREVEAALREVENARVWGTTASEANRVALAGLLALHRGEYEAAEQGLTIAIEAPDLRVIRTSLLWARARVRYLRKELRDAMADMDRVKGVRQGETWAWNDSGLIRLGVALEADCKGADTRETYRAAVADFAEAVKLNSKDADLYNDRGLALEGLGDAEERHGEDGRASYGKAISDYGEAIRRYQYSRAYDNRGNAYWKLGAADVARGKDGQESFKKAIADSDEALRLNPEDTLAYNNRGLALESLGSAESASGRDGRGSYEKAIADLGEALRRDPEYAEAYYNRGTAFEALSQAMEARGVENRETLGKAITDFNEVLKRCPDHAQAYTNRGVVFWSLGRAENARGRDGRANYQRAIDDYGQALKRRPDLVQAYTDRGLAFKSLGEEDTARGGDGRASFQDAISDLGEALKRNARFTSALVTRGETYMCLGDALGARGEDGRESYQFAIADFDAALIVNPNSADARNNRGLAFKGLGEAECARGGDGRESFQKAVAEFDAALARDAAHWRAYANKGSVCEAIGEFSKAVECYQRALRICPNQPVVELALAQAKARSASGAAPPWITIIGEAGRSAEGGDYARARVRYEQALVQAPAEPDASSRPVLEGAHYNLACIFSLASEGKEGPNAEAKPIAADEAARLRESAFQHLRAALDLGYTDTKHLAEDTDLAPLHADPRWEGLLGKK